MNLKIINSLVFLLLFLLACQNPSKKEKEYIFDSQTSTRIVAFEDAPFIIGVTHESQVTNLEVVRNQGITLGFNGLDLLAYARIHSPAYLTAKGIKVGDSKKMVQERYGVPYTFLGAIKSPTSDALIYGNLMFLFSKQDSVKSIILSEIR